jgi:hypothetical protein
MPGSRGPLFAASSLVGDEVDGVWLGTPVIGFSEELTTTFGDGVAIAEPGAGGFETKDGDGNRLGRESLVTTFWSDTLLDTDVGFWGVSVGFLGTWAEVAFEWLSFAETAGVAFPVDAVGCPLDLEGGDFDTKMTGVPCGNVPAIAVGFAAGGSVGWFMWLIVWLSFEEAGPWRPFCKLWDGDVGVASAVCGRLFWTREVDFPDPDIDVLVTDFEVFAGIWSAWVDGALHWDFFTELGEDLGTKLSVDWLCVWESDTAFVEPVEFWEFVLWRTACKFAFGNLSLTSDDFFAIFEFVGAGRGGGLYSAVIVSFKEGDFW